MKSGIQMNENDIIDESDEQINLEGLQSSICVRLASLSAVSDTPNEFANSSTQFTSDAIGYSDGTWIPALVSVQGWLRFERDLEVSPADVFIPTLVEALGGDTDDDIVIIDGVATLTESGLAQLDDRLDRAVQHQETFTEAYGEETGTRASATAAWAEAWGQDEDDADDDAVGVVQATTDSWHISTFIKTNMNLTPSYQRGDVWSTAMRQKLIESILRGIPLPSIILLQPEDPDLPHEVVDGKQRLTAILRFAGKHPRAIAYAQELDEKHPGHNMVTLLQEDYPKFRNAWKAIHHTAINAAVEQEHFLPFKLRKRPKSLKGTKSPIDGVWGKYYSQISDVKVGVDRSKVLVSQIFETAPKYKIPVIEYTSTHPRQIHEVFNLYNRQGVHLNAEEIRNALYHEFEIARALLVAGDDADIKNVNVPALRNITAEMQRLARNVSEYGVSPTRYRRTKIMSWVVATLLHEDPSGSLPSTAKHIDNFLDRVRDDVADPMRGAGTLEDLFRWIGTSVEWHAGAGDETWARTFQSSLSRGGWQELQLVGSIIGVAIVFAAHPESAGEMLDDASEALYEASQTSRAGWDKSAWARPAKTQTREQWQCIANIANAVVEIAGADKDAAHQALVRNYGSSGVADLLTQAKTYA